MGSILGATILSGRLQGEVVFLPQIPMILSDSPTHSNVCNFRFAWHFLWPLMSQGQTMTICDLDLETLAFRTANFMLHVVGLCAIFFVADPRQVVLQHINFSAAPSIIKLLTWSPKMMPTWLYH
ncbi:hypothetical protein TNCV_3054531 [Trichonephila clavipes]|nr:hypothetical protein TNCV_3054531 [Trichonephila clavipes]